MSWRKVTAIVRTELLERVEAALEAVGCPGFTVTPVWGCGEYADYYRRNHLTRHARVECFVPETQADSLVQAILEAAHTGQPGDGMVAVLPVEHFYRIRTRQEAEDP